MTKQDNESTKHSIQRCMAGGQCDAMRTASAYNVVKSFRYGRDVDGLGVCDGEMRVGCASKRTVRIGDVVSRVGSWRKMR